MIKRKKNDKRRVEVKRMEIDLIPYLVEGITYGFRIILPSMIPFMVWLSFTEEDGNGFGLVGKPIFCLIKRFNFFK